MQCMPSQSHHFGIETRIQTGWSWKRGSLNRTILELKPMKNQNRVRCAILSIAPFWNWNLIQVQTAEGWFKLSIAPFWNWNPIPSFFQYSIFDLSIAPFWNWNYWYFFCIFNKGILSIAPFWNWNVATPLRPALGGNLSIAPFWNWNSSATYLLSGFSSLNRTILELKLRKLSSMNIFIFTLNRTILELKLCGCNRAIR